MFAYYIETTILFFSFWLCNTFFCWSRLAFKTLFKLLYKPTLNKDDLLTYLLTYLLLSSAPYATLCPTRNSMFVFFVYWTIHQLLCSKIDFSSNLISFSLENYFFRDLSHPTWIRHFGWNSTSTEHSTRNLLDNSKSFLLILRLLNENNLLRC